MKTAFCFLFLLMAFVLRAQAGPREVVALLSWDFAEERTLGVRPAEADGWKKVTIPHVFRQAGLPDDTAGWYRFSADAPQTDAGRTVYLRLEGAASVKEVFINGHSVGQHRGAFSGAVFDLTAQWKSGASNEIAVRVSNRDEEALGCFSRSQLYYVNGGMFRPAWLIKTDAVHVFPEMGSSGVYLTPRNITAEAANLGVSTVVRNELPTAAEVTIRQTVTDPKNVPVASFFTVEKIAGGETKTVKTTGKIPNPKLWDLGKPNLYQVRTELLVGGRVTDEVTERTGLRTIAFREGRFFLNGREVQFRGVNKHEQTEDGWNAFDPENSRREFSQLADLGINTVRLAHYPHSSLEYDLADQKGLAVWAENGFAGQIWQKDAPISEKEPTPDGERLTREMVRQLWNHPGILFWSAGNETIVETVERYADVIRAEDGTRLITYAANAREPRNVDFVARNTYRGWYGGQLAGFAERAGNAIIAETGAGSVATHHVPYADAFRWQVNHFEPEEYAQMFAEYRMQIVAREDIAERPMFLWWLFRDFYDHKFKDQINTKGLVDFGGQPKDLYFLFQAFLRPDYPVLRLCGRDFFLRGFAPGNGIKAYGNAAEAELFINGVAEGKRRDGDYRLPDSPEKNADGSSKSVGIPVAHVFFWNAALSPGRNVVLIRDNAGRSDEMIIYQKAADGSLPLAATAPVENVVSSNPENPVFWIDRAADSQGPVYSDVDGSSDNTFDQVPPELRGASRFVTRRLSDPALKTDLSFTSKGGKVFVLFSTGHFPTTTLKAPDPATIQAAERLQKTLTEADFAAVGTKTVWRDHELNRAEAALWSRQIPAGTTLKIPGETLDYAVFFGTEPSAR